jgi:hypothetical protein
MLFYFLLLKNIAEGRFAAVKIGECSFAALNMADCFMRFSATFSNFQLLSAISSNIRRHSFAIAYISQKYALAQSMTSWSKNTGRNTISRLPILSGSVSNEAFYQ